MTNPKNIIARLRGEMIAKHVTNPLQEARDEFRLLGNTVSGYPELVSELIRFERHIYRRCFDAPDMPDDHLWGEVTKHLARGGTIEWLLPRAVHGLDGGMSGGVLAELLQAHEQELTQRYVDHVLSSEVDPYDYDGILSLIDYIRREFGHLVDLPLEPGLLAMRWRQLVQWVASAITQANRNLGR